MKTSMESLKLLIISGLLFNVAIAIRYDKSSECASNLLKYRLPVRVTECRHYNIRLIPNIEESYYEGEIGYFIEIHQITKTISLYSHTQIQLYPDATTLARHSDGEIHSPEDNVYCAEAQILTIEFNDKLIPGNYTLNMKFRNELNSHTRNFYKILYKDDYGYDKLVLGINIDRFARTVFPCWDEPAFRATFNISVRHSQLFKAVSNMPLRVQSKDGDMVWTHFQTTPLISTHHVGLVMSNDLISISNDNKSITVWGRPKVIANLQYVYTIAEKFLAFVTWYTNMTVKFPKMNHVVVPDVWFRPTSSWGLYIYREADFMLDPNLSAIDQEVRTTVLSIQKMVYQWFNPSPRNHMSLNEAIAQFFVLYVTDKFFENLRLTDIFVVKSHHALSKDVASRLLPVLSKNISLEDIENDEPVFPLAIRLKATALIRMMYHILTDDIFRKGISAYLQKYQFMSAIPDDLWATLQETSEKYSVSDDYELHRVMYNWLWYSNYPVLNVTRSNDKDSVYMIAQDRLYMQEEDENNVNIFWMPITYASQSNPNFNYTTPSMWLQSTNEQVYIPGNPQNKWVIFNLQQMGYYRVNYDIDNWRRLADYLRSDHYTNIHPINRAQLIDDSYHLMLAGHLDSSVFLDLTSYLSQETDYIPWYSMHAILSNMSTFFLFSESKLVKLHMAKLVSDCLEYMGYEEHKDDTDLSNRLRLLMVKWACDFGHDECLRTANAKLNEYLKDPEAHVIPSEWRHWIFCKGMVKANVYNWWQMLNEYSRTNDKRYIEFLACAENPSIIINYLKMLSYNYITITENTECIDTIISVIKKHITKNSILDYVLENHDKIIPNQIVRILDEVIQNTYHEEQFYKLKKFLTNQPSIDENILEYLRSLIAKQSTIIQAEINMFTNLFNTVNATDVILRHLQTDI